MVARMERLVTVFDEVESAWALVTDEKLSEMQKERVRAVVAGLEERLVKVKGRVG